MEQTKKKRLSFNDDFEMLYLRHEYMEKINKLGKKLDPSYIQKYAGVVHTTAKIMYNKLKPNFQKCGFDQEDFVAITNMYMLFYMALYSIQTNPEEMEALINKRGPQPESEIVRIDRNNMISFLRQRLYHCSTLFGRKARSITVGEDRHGFYAKTDKSIEVSEDLLLENYEKYGYRKVTSQEMKTAEEQAKIKGKVNLVDVMGHKIVKIERMNQGLSEYDFKLLSFDEKGSFYNTPDTILQNTEEELALEAFKVKFEKLTKEKKRRMLVRFIEKNKDNRFLKEEVKFARKLLSRRSVVV